MPMSMAVFQLVAITVISARRAVHAVKCGNTHTDTDTQTQIQAVAHTKANTSPIRTVATLNPFMQERNFSFCRSALSPHFNAVCSPLFFFL